MPDGKTYFGKSYECFEGAKRGRIEGYVRVIWIHGCFLKGVYYRELLCVMGRDKDNHIYLISWVIICVEYKENSKWFLEFLTGDLNLDVGKALTLILDQHKGMHLLNFFLFNLGLLIYA